MITLLIAGTASVITYFVVVDVVRRHLSLGRPNQLAIPVALLAFLGLARDGERISRILTLPYEALALAILVLFLIRFLRGPQAVAPEAPKKKKFVNSLRRWSPPDGFDRKPTAKGVPPKTPMPQSPTTATRVIPRTPGRL